MLREIRQSLVNHLWSTYCTTTPQFQQIVNALSLEKVPLDHIACIDLPSEHTGIPTMTALLSLIGFEKQGAGYLPSKQNDFIWVAEEGAHKMLARQVLPQIVVADFRLNELPNKVRTIIEKYAHQSKSVPFEDIKIALYQAQHGDMKALDWVKRFYATYFQGRNWSLPTLSEFHTVHAFNELLAWVLIFGRKPNHFTLPIHLLDRFENFDAFITFIETSVKLPLNTQGGRIKGDRSLGILQSATQGTPQRIELTDGYVDLPVDFVEFVWRFSNDPHPQYWGDYFTGFIANQANDIIQSLYVVETAE